MADLRVYQFLKTIKRRVILLDLNLHKFTNDHNSKNIC